MKWQKRIGLFILMIIIMAALIYGFWPKPVPVDTARVEHGPLQVTIEEEGKTRVVDRYSISTPISGFSRRIEDEKATVAMAEYTETELKRLKKLYESE